MPDKNLSRLKNVLDGAIVDIDEVFEDLRIESISWPIDNEISEYIMAGISDITGMDTPTSTYRSNIVSVIGALLLSDIGSIQMRFRELDDDVVAPHKLADVLKDSGTIEDCNDCLKIQPLVDELLYMDRIMPNMSTIGLVYNSINRIIAESNLDGDARFNMLRISKRISDTYLFIINMQSIIQELMFIQRYLLDSISIYDLETLRELGEKKK